MSRGFRDEAYYVRGMIRDRWSMRMSLVVRRSRRGGEGRVVRCFGRMSS